MLLFFVLGNLFKNLQFFKEIFQFIFRFSPNKKYLVASSENCCIDFFEVQNDKLKRVGYVTRIEDPVTQIDWSSNSKYIRVMCFVY